jgi:hypothetical protein
VAKTSSEPYDHRVGCLQKSEQSLFLQHIRIDLLSVLLKETDMTEARSRSDFGDFYNRPDKGHICWLSQMGLRNAAHHLTDNPTVICSKCNAKANMPHYVCFPIPLAGEQLL